MNWSNRKITRDIGNRVLNNLAREHWAPLWQFTLRAIQIFEFNLCPTRLGSLQVGLCLHWRVLSILRASVTPSFSLSLPFSFLTLSTEWHNADGRRAHFVAPHCLWYWRQSHVTEQIYERTKACRTSSTPHLRDGKHWGWSVRFFLFSHNNRINYF